MKRMFRDCSNIRTINMRYLTTSKVTDMPNMFNWEKFNKINIENLKTGDLKNMMGIFRGIKYINSIDVSKIDTSQVENMSYMLSDCNYVSEFNSANFIANTFSYNRYLSTVNLSSFCTTQDSIIIIIFYFIY